MHKKLSRLLEPKMGPYFICLALFSIIAIPIKPVLALAEAVALAALWIFYRRQSSKRRRSVMQYIETMAGGVDSISKSSMFLYMVLLMAIGIIGNLLSDLVKMLIPMFM